MTDIHRQRIITSENDVPAGYVQMIEFGNAVSGRLSLATKAGHIPSVKIMKYTTDIRGNVYLNKALTQEWLDQPAKQKTAAKKNEPMSITYNIEDSIKHMQTTLDRQNTLLTLIAKDLGYSE